MADTMIQETAAGATWPQQDRRRPGRMSNPSPELIALMRKPTAEARRRVALYDAPNFVLQQQESSRRGKPVKMLHVVGALAISGGAFGGAFSAMMVLWG